MVRQAAQPFPPLLGLVPNAVNMAPMATEVAITPLEPDQPCLRSSVLLHTEDRTTHFKNDMEDEGNASVELAAIMTTTSTPVVPGPSSPPLDPPRTQDFAPPTRPSSTPFPHPEPRSDDIRYARLSTDTIDDAPDVSPSSPVASTLCHVPDKKPVASLDTLPTEIHECIIDHLFGYRISPSSLSSRRMYKVTTSISTMLRHSRRKELSQLAFINMLYRSLVQERLFRHVKIRASHAELRRAATFFAEHPRLRDYVKHVEVWFPVFQPKFAMSLSGAPMDLPTITEDGFALTTYTLPTDNSALDEVFGFVGTTFPGVQVLTLEGGDRRKAPKVRNFCQQRGGATMPPVVSVKTLVTKGQWNLIRGIEDFEQLMFALPSLQEWHGSYTKPKSKSYITMIPILKALPPKLCSINIHLEADYRRELTCPPFFLKVMAQGHFCSKLALASQSLEHISYTGRICHHFFNLAADLADARNTRLRSINITVRNCCRSRASLRDSGSGITDMSFIDAFEQLVLSAIRAIEKLTALEYLKIRYVDLGKSQPWLFDVE